MADPLRVAIADDHPAFLEGLRQVVASADGMEVVGTATTSAELVDLAARVEPDVIVLDIGMPDFPGIEATEQVVAARPGTKVLILSTFDREEYVQSAIRAGARGYLTKTAMLAEIVQAISAVAAGQLIFGTDVAPQIIGRFRQSPEHPTEPPFPELTSREREVLTLVAQGYRNLDIARRLQIKPKTVQNHLSNIFAALRVADRSEAIRRAQQEGLHP